MPAPQKVRIFLVDDHLIVREGLTEILRLQKDFTVVGDAGSLKDAAPLLEKIRPDILMLDLRMPGEFGLDLLKQIPEITPETRVIILTGSDEPPDVVEAMRLGARGFIQKHAATDLILKSIRKVAEGEIWLDSTMTETVLQAFQSRQQKPDQAALEISPRERQIIELVIEGCKNKEIARRLFISEKTVKNHLSNIFDKLGVDDRVELALKVMEKKILLK